MNLSYSVLWFDDTQEFYDSLDLDSLQKEIRSWGFSPRFEPITTAEEFAAREPYDDFDLLVIDFNLEEYGHGQTFIENLRSHNIYTEVIFYSANPSEELWEAIRTHRLEGVFVANRQTVRDKIERVASQSVRKVLDLENMRGIVMAEVGTIDLLLDDIIEAAVGSLNADARGQIYKRFHEQVSAFNESGRKDLEKFIAEPSARGMLDLCDSYKRWTSLRRLQKQVAALRDFDLGKYDEEVLSPRNFLAHGFPELQDNGGYKFVHRGKSYIYDHDVSTGLRATILRYRELFERVKQRLAAD